METAWLLNVNVLLSNGEGRQMIDKLPENVVEAVRTIRNYCNDYGFCDTCQLAVNRKGSNVKCRLTLTTPDKWFYKHKDESVADWKKFTKKFEREDG